MAKDPVCGMDVDEKTSKLKSDYKGHTYYFCAPGCLRSFEKEPAKYAASAAAAEHEHDHEHGHDHDHGHSHSH